MEQDVSKKKFETIHEEDYNYDEGGAEVRLSSPDNDSVYQTMQHQRDTINYTEQ
jgi:hypothetical protein